MNEVNAALEHPKVWDEPKRAQELGREKRTLEAVVQTIDHLTSNLSDNTELFEMSKADLDEAGMLAIEADAQKLQATVAELEFRRMFNNPADPLNCFVDIQAGAGGTEACDWASMLLRQYLKYAERKGFKTTMEDETDGDVAGIKSATIKVEGEYAFAREAALRAAEAFELAGDQTLATNQLVHEPLMQEFAAIFAGRGLEPLPDPRDYKRS